MYCRHCGAEMQEDQNVCTACGEKNAQPSKKINWKPIVAAVCCVALAVGLIAMVLAGGKGEDITSKASYTGTDAQVLAALDTVVATAGDLELTNRELQIAYWTVIYDFISYYGDYATYWIDFATPLDQQYFDATQTTTWQQYFLESAINTWRRYEVLVKMSQAENIPMSKELEDYFASLPEKMEESMSTHKFNSINEMVVHDFGVGSDYASYEAFMRIYHYSNEHYTRLQERQTASEAEIEAYYANNYEAFENAGCTKEDGSIVNVRHILIAPGADSEKPFTDAMWATAEVRAQALLNTWLQGPADEAFFGELAKTNSDCPSAAQGGLIPDITKGQMVKEFEDWCMAPHEYGDYGIVKTSYGYHLMFYINGSELWYNSAKSGVLSKKISDILTAEEEKYPLTVNYSEIVLGEAKMG